MANFDWRTDEDKDWDQPPAQAQMAVQKTGRRRAVLRLARQRWRVLLAVLLVTAAAGLLGVRGATLRVQAVTAAARQDVEHAHGVMLQAASAGDAELYLSILGGDRSWRQMQLAALERGALFQRRTFGLEWQPEVAPINELYLSPELQQAVVTSTLQYEGYVGGERQMTGLRHLLYYERDGDQWRLVPAKEPLWDGWVLFRRERMEAVFPRRDQELGGRLMQDMQSAVQDICDLIINCPPELDLELQFDTDIDLLSAPRLSINSMRRNAYSLYLPTPSLVGVPVDDAGYRVLQTAYQRAIAEQLFNALSRGVGGASSTLHDARLRGIFAEMDVTPWPPTLEDDAGVFSISGDILALCANTPGGGASLLRYVAASDSWRTELTGRNLLQMTALFGVPGVLLREQHETERRTSEPQPDVIWWGDGRELALFEDYFLGNITAGSPAFVAGALDGQSTWIFLGGAEACNGRHCSGIVARTEPTTWSPDGQHTLFRREQEGSRSPPAADDMLWLGDGSGEAIARLEEGFYPFWIDDETFGYLVTPQGRAQTFPFDYELVVRRLEGGGVSDARVIRPAMMEALQQLADEGAEIEAMGIVVNQVFAHASRPQTVYLSGVRFTNLLSSVAMPQASAYLFAVDLQSGDVSVRVPNHEVHAIIMPSVSPDGRWLAYLAQIDEGVARAAGTANAAGTVGTVAVHDLTADPARAKVFERSLASGSVSFGEPGIGSAPYDWSEKSGQLLILEEGVLTVLEPGGWEARQIIPPTAACAHAAWAD